MKRILPYILIVLIFVQLLAPFTVGGERKNVAEAAEVTTSIVEIVDASLSDKVATIQTSATVTDEYQENTLEKYDDLFLVIKINKTDGTPAQPEKKTNISNLSQNLKMANNVIEIKIFEDLTPNTTYSFVATVEGVIDAGASVELLKSTTITGTTLTSGNTDQISQGGSVHDNGDVSGLPVCMKGLIPQPGGCAAQLLYYVLFVPTSYIFALAGTFFDFTFHYSVQDESYRTPFVVEGWGLVRDFCNMFFIFILLYIAFGTVLNIISTHKMKEMIINVVIIGLLINFSLFATQVIIDASNILARVFYNSNTIKITQGDGAANGVQDSGLRPKLKIGPNGEIPLSEAIVNKVNPQNLIINGRKAVVIQDKVTGETADSEKEGNLGTGAFILITILATAVNIVGIIAFLSIGLIFVARVIGLWMAMIFAPFAFFSYTVPSLQDMEMVGWKKWWPETLKLAFLAPIFIFFMYLIIAFLETGLGLVKSNDITGGTGTTFVISIIVPFIFIMILLMKAKDIAKKMSGTMGQSITNGIAAVGGLALGGAALGTAMLGRKVVGAGLASASRSEGAMNRATQKIAFNKKLEDWSSGKTQGPEPKWSKHVEDYEKTTGKKLEKGLFTRLGAKLNEKQMNVGDIDHARHEEDEIKKAVGLEGVDNKNLSGENIKAMESKFNQMKRSDAESAVRKGVDAKGNDLLLTEKDSMGNVINSYKGENAFKSAKRKEISDDILSKDESINNGDVEEEIKKVKTTTKKFNPNTNLMETVEGEKEVKTGKRVLTKQGEKKLEDELNIKLSATVKMAAEEKLAHDFTHIREKASKPVGQLERGFSKANKGSYDIRDISNMKSDKREGFLTKVPVALIAGIATGVRAGMKNVGTSNGGVKVQGDFMKDLSNVIGDSLKSMKVSVDLSHVGEHKSSADSHGGDHGGGHH